MERACQEEVPIMYARSLACGTRASPASVTPWMVAGEVVLPRGFAHVSVVVEPNLRNPKIQDLRDLPPNPATQTRKSGKSTFTQKQEIVKFKFSHTAAAAHAPNRQAVRFLYTAAAATPFQPHPTSHHHSGRSTGNRTSIHTMKRSRTCQCLVELDSPKRTRSTPDLAALRRKHNSFERRERTLDDSMMTASAAGLDGPLHILWRASSQIGRAHV